VVELVDDDAVEPVRGYAIEVPVQPLDGGEDHVRFEVGSGAGRLAQRAFRMDLAEDLKALLQDLLAVGDEERPVSLAAVERGEPGLPESGRHDHQPGAVTFGAGRPQSVECLGLDRPWRGELDGFLGHQRGGSLTRGRNGATPGPVVGNPLVVDAPRPVPELVERPAERIDPVDL
jgi:hypothetical protein